MECAPAVRSRAQNVDGVKVLCELDSVVKVPQVARMMPSTLNDTETKREAAVDQPLRLKKNMTLPP